MKKTRIALIVVVAIVFSAMIAFGQSSVTLSTVSRIDVSFTGKADFVTNVTNDNAGNFITGGTWVLIPSDTAPEYKAGLAKSSPSGQLIWKTAWGGDTLCSTVQNQVVYDSTTNAIFAATFEGITSTPVLIARFDANTGKQVWQITREPYSFYFLHVWNGKLVAINTGVEATVYLINEENGSIDGSFNAGWVNGDVDMVTIDDTLWIFGERTTEKFLLPSGQPILKSENTNFTAVPFLIYGTIDDSGNVYLCASDTWDRQKGRTLYASEKLSSGGQQIWKNAWYGWPADSISLNLNNWVQGIVLNKTGNLAVIYGSTQLFGTSGYQMNYCSAYLVFVNPKNGDTLSTQKWNDDQWSDPMATQWMDGYFNSQNQLVLLGESFPGTSPYHKSHNFIKIFDVDVVDAVHPEPTLPSAFTLEQNYPNPFNPTTTIRYSIPKRSFVTLSVYNILGQLVKTLVQNEKSPGTYETSFDGSSLPSGVYLSILRAGSSTEMRKMVLLK